VFSQNGFSKKMRLSTFLLILFLLPFFGALGHDLYIAYGEQDFSEAPKFSDLGFLWVTYHVDSFKWAREAIDPENWSRYMTPLLELPSIIAAGIIPAIIILVMCGMKLKAKIMDRAVTAPGRGFAFKSGLEKKGGKFNYKRK